MVKLKFIVKDGSLVLRISENKVRFYKSVMHLLIGGPNIEKHWSSDKEKFTSYAVSYMENNKILAEYKSNYVGLVMEHPGLTPKQVAQYKFNGKVELIERKDEDGSSISVTPNRDLVEQFLEIVIVREKAKQGCNFEVYEKLLRKCRKILNNFSLLSFQEINYDKCVAIAKEFANYDGYKGTAKCFRNLLGKASKDKDVSFSIAQIGDFAFSDFNPKINEIETKRPDILNQEQLKSFLNLDLFNTTPTYKQEKIELYHDFCLFMFHSFMAPCDVIKLKYKDINKDRVIAFKRKKTHAPVEIPVNPIMEKIINKYRGRTKDGYVFPIMDEERERGSATKDYLFKRFRGQLNVWLKIVGKELQIGYNLYAYVFRHTAITLALDKGIPLSYVAMVAGTSIDMIQKHYYNGQNHTNKDKLQLAFIQAAM